MSSRSTTADLFERGRRDLECLEIDRLIGTIERDLGIGDPQPVSIGRYLIQERLGAGGLGLVYRAVDPDLDRVLAIKVLKHGKGDVRHEARLMEEARALAQVDHPNVVRVFDVGLFEDHGLPRSFVAMELIEGSDLHAWLRQPRSRNEVLDVFIEAAQGLAAVHDAGLLHRDFKPGNVLIGNDGRVRVADFGMAALLEELAAESVPTDRIAHDTSTGSQGLVGTPRYMAPEQHLGHVLTASCDQYAFCISLFEALLRQPPFSGRGPRELLDQKLEGPSFPARPRVSARLRRLLHTGLQPAPEHRYKDMLALRNELRACRNRRYRGLAAAGICVAAAFAIPWGQTESSPTQCPAAPVAEDPAPLPRSEDPSLGSLLHELDTALTDYQAEVTSRWDAECSRPSQTRPAVLQCLTQCTEAASDLRVALRESTADAVSQGWQLVDALPEPAACTSPTSAAQGKPWSAALARVQMHDALGNFVRARNILERLRDEIATQGDPRSQRRIDLQLGRLTVAEGRFEDATVQLEAVYLDADAAGDAHTAGGAATGLVGAHAQLGSTQAAIRWAKMGAAQLRRAEPRDVTQEISLAHNLALAHFEAGQLREAEETIARAIERSKHADASAERFAARQLHAEILLYSGRPAQSLQIHRELIETDLAQSDRFPGRHMMALFGLGNALMTLRNHAEACETYAEAQRRARAILGRKHPTAASICVNYALCLAEQRPRDALPHGRGCIESLRASLGEQHPTAILAGAAEGRLQSAAGDPAAGARTLRERATALEQQLGPTHFATIDALHQAGVSLLAAGDPDAALAYLSDALARRREALRPDHVDVFESLASVAMAEHALGRNDEAREHLHEAIAGFEKVGLHPDYVAKWRNRLEEMEPQR